MRVFRKGKRCKECGFLRSDIQVETATGMIPKIYGKITSPCNRYPRNIMRHPDEPVCGEFKKGGK